MEHGKMTIDEVEQYDDVVCFLDEEQTPKIYAERIERSRRRQCDFFVCSFVSRTEFFLMMHTSAEAAATIQFSARTRLWAF